jgi:hypothetical protein
MGAMTPSGSPLHASFPTAMAGTVCSRPFQQGFPTSRSARACEVTCAGVSKTERKNVLRTELTTLSWRTREFQTSLKRTILNLHMRMQKCAVHTCHFGGSKCACYHPLYLRCAIVYSFLYICASLPHAHSCVPRPPTCLALIHVHS